MKYPTDIVNDDYGQHRIHQGHGLDHDMLRADLIEHSYEPRGGGELAVDEVWLNFHPRIKWCSKTGAGGGWGCDEEGTWHSHWFASKQGYGEPFTLAYWETATVPSVPHTERPSLLGRATGTAVES